MQRERFIGLFIAVGAATATLVTATDPASILVIGSAASFIAGAAIPSFLKGSRGVALGAAALVLGIIVLPSTSSVLAPAIVAGLGVLGFDLATRSTSAISLVALARVALIVAVTTITPLVALPRLADVSFAPHAVATGGLIVLAATILAVSRREIPQGGAS